MKVKSVLSLGADGQAQKKNIVIEPGRFEDTDPFLMMAEDWFVPAEGFPDHPHRGFETITLVVEGELEHKDNHGGQGVLQAGDVQWMTAGKGVVHSEMARNGAVHTLQLWLNLPARLKMTAPRYQDLRAREVPKRTEDGVVVRVFSGKSGDVTADTKTHVPITMLDVDMKADATFKHDLNASDNAFFYVLSGAVTAQGKEVKAGRVAWPDAGSIEFTCTDDARFVFFAGATLDEPVVQHGSFVMNRPEEIEAAIADFKGGRF